MMRVILQARTSSSRLPGKALLPLAGLPSAILAARRAGNCGDKIVLAMPDDPSDDLLATCATQHGVSIFRGPLDDVQARFILACDGMADDDVLVRLTADNPLVDGHFLHELRNEFLARDVPYLGTDWPVAGLPYGLSAEIMRFGSIKQARAASDTAYSREHVTPWLRQQPGAAVMQARQGMALSHLWATMDQFDDYSRLQRVFAGIDDPVNTHWTKLVDRLANDPEAPRRFTPGPGLVLGTAQLGAPYGSVSKARTTPPAQMQANQLVQMAIRNQALAIDTARAYPDSEQTLGRAMIGGWTSRTRVITKLSPLADLAEDASAKTAAAQAEISVLRSLQALGNGICPDLMLHRCLHLASHGGAIFARLQEMQQEGLIGRLGVSVQSVAEADEALSHPDVTMIQLACNPIDDRWEKAGFIDRLRATREDRPDLVIHIRSVFLQGVLLRPPEFWPPIAGLNAARLRKVLIDAARNLGHPDVASLCIAYMRGQDWLDGLVLGMEHPDQMASNLAHFTRPPLTTSQMDNMRSDLGNIPETLLNPALWPAS